MTAQTKLFGEGSSRGDLEQVLWKAADILRGAVRKEVADIKGQLKRLAALIRTK